MVNAGGIYSELVLDGDKYFNTLNKADRETRNFEGKLKAYGKSIEKAGKAWTAKVTAPILGIGAITTKLGMDFQATMSEVGAISGATGEDLERLEKKAREMGATTKYSATQAGEALTYMAMAGWETEDMLNGIEGVMNLASASGEDLATVADIVTDSLTAFGLQAKDSGHFADVLAKASSSSNTNVGIMGETFKYVAPLAGALGYTIEDTALAVGLMANAGIKGSQAGTALRGMLTNLIKPTKESAEAMEKLGIEMANADGTMKPLTEVMGDLRKAFSELDPEQQGFYASQIAGQQAMSGFLAIVNASEDDFVKLKGNIDNANGAAKEMADIMQDNLKGRWLEFKSLLEEGALQIFELLIPALEKWLEKGKQFVEWFNNLDEGTKNTIIKIAGLTAAIGPLLLVGGKLAGSISSIIGLFGKVAGPATTATTAVSGLTGGMGALGGVAKAGLSLINPWTIGIGAIGITAIAVAKDLRQEAIPAMVELDDTVSETTKNAYESFLELEQGAKVAFNTLAWGGAEVTEEMKNDVLANTNEMADGVIAKLEEEKAEALEILNEMLENSTDISEKEKEERIRIASEKYDEEINKAKESKEKIAEILEEARKENRAITESEKTEIERILTDLKDESIRLMSESQEEQEAILENLKANSERMTAEMASDVIKNSLKQKEETINKANEQYEQVIKTANLLKKDGTKESIELADNMIAEAERQKKEVVRKAEQTHNDVLSEVEAQGKDIIKQINLDNGEIKTKWQNLKEWFNKNPIIRKIKEVDASSRTLVGNIPRNALGTNYFPGGLTMVGEQGRELVELPKGSKIFSNQKTTQMFYNQAQAIGNIQVEVPITIDGKQLARATATITSQELQRLKDRKRRGGR